MATGSELDDNDHQKPAGFGRVLRYTNGHWEDQPTLGTNFTCANDDKTADSETIGWTLDPQSDDTLKGTVTQLVITDEMERDGDIGLVGPLLDQSLFVFAAHHVERLGRANPGVRPLSV